MGSYYLDDFEIKVTIQDGATINAFVTAVGPQGIPGEVNVLDNLTSTSVVDALSANQGRVLDGKITTVSTDLDTLEGKMAPLIDTGGFYAPVDFNTFKCTATTTATAGIKIPLTKIIGGLSISSDAITLPKGYLYSVFVDFDFTSAGGTGEATMDITDLSNNSKLQRYCNKTSVYLVSAAASSTGNGIIDLTSAASNLVVKAYVRAASGNPYISPSLGGVYITKYKLIPFTT